jgi:uncharacterized phiE125 gp8 family phage protein
MGRYALTTVTASTTDSVPLANLKQQLNVSTTDDDALLLRMIGWAEAKFEADTSRKLCNATLAMYMDEFPMDGGPIRIPRSPVANSSGVVITYVNSSAGTTSTWATSDYQVDRYSEPPRIYPAYGASYPCNVRAPVMNAVKVQFVAGYATSGGQNIPPLAAQAIHMAVAEQYRHREVGAWDEFAETGWQNIIGLSRWE